MKVEVGILYEVLHEALADINKQPNTFINGFKKLAFKMYGFTNGEMAFILNGKTPVELMSKDTLFKLTRVLYEINKSLKSTFNIDRLDVKKYFTENEEMLYNEKIDRTKKDEDIVIKAGNWMQIEEDQYVIKIYPDELINDYINRDKINYNMETQRYLTKLKTKNGDDIEVITFDGDACEEIFNDMYNGLYISNVLALNVNPDFNTPPRIVNGNIVISNEAEIDCIDGYHRLRAAINTKLRKPEWNQPLVFFLFICDVQKACRYILEEDEKIHLTKEQVTKSDDSNAANFIIKKMNEDLNFVLRGTITDNKNMVINKAIEKLFNPSKLYTTEDRQKAVQLYNFIKKNINDYIENNNLYEVETTKEMWLIYLCALKFCMDKKLDFGSIVGKLDINKISNEINFTKTPSDKHYNIIREKLKNV